MYKQLITEFSEYTHRTKSNDIDKFLLDVARVLEQYLDSLESILKNNEEDIFEKCFSKNNHEKLLDYDRYAIPFAKKYFMKNFWKAVSTFLNEPRIYPKKILDIGCGSGAISIAYLCVLQTSLTKSTKWEVEIEFIDRSKAQINLIKEILNHIKSNFKNLVIKPIYTCIDIINWEPLVDHYDLVLMGHVLTENKSNVFDFLSLSIKSLRADGRVIIIERKDDPIWEDINLISMKLFLPSYFGQSIFSDEYSNFNSNEMQFQTHFQVISYPRKIMIQLLQNYFRAWKEKSIKLVEEIFSQDATYSEASFKELYRGVEQIKNYWKKNVLSQQDIKIEIIRTGYFGNCVYSEWEVKFEKNNKRKHLKGFLALKINIAEGKIASLIEYFNKIPIREEENGDN